MITKFFLIFILVIFCSLRLFSQTITGKVSDFSTDEPLEYASIGVINTSICIITDINGNFKIDITGQSPKSIVRVSMISYKSQTFTIEELLGKDNIIKLKSDTIHLKEVVIKPMGKPRKIGNMDYNQKRQWFGWGGGDYGKGNERGIKLELGKEPVFLESLHVHIHRQSFDSSLVRLHIRNIQNSEPSTELMNENIIFSITKESGWADFDLSKYGLVLNGEVILSLEWIKAYGLNKNREINVNNNVINEYLLINEAKKGNIYSRFGTEAKWVVIDSGSPSIYLTIRE